MRPPTRDAPFPALLVGESDEEWHEPPRGTEARVVDLRPRPDRAELVARARSPRRRSRRAKVDEEDPVQPRGRDYPPIAVDHELIRRPRDEALYCRARSIDMSPMTESHGEQRSGASPVRHGMRELPHLLREPESSDPKRNTRRKSRTGRRPKSRQLSVDRAADRAVRMYALNGPGVDVVAVKVGDDRGARCPQTVYQGREEQPRTPRPTILRAGRGSTRAAAVAGTADVMASLLSMGLLIEQTSRRRNSVTWMQCVIRTERAPFWQNALRDRLLVRGFRATNAICISTGDLLRPRQRACPASNGIPSNFFQAPADAPGRCPRCRRQRGSF